jgi:hypothetical protein
MSYNKLDAEIEFYLCEAFLFFFDKKNTNEVLSFAESNIWEFISGSQHFLAGIFSYRNCENLKPSEFLYNFFLNSIVYDIDANFYYEIICLLKNFGPDKDIEWDIRGLDCDYQIIKWYLDIL